MAVDLETYGHFIEGATPVVDVDAPSEEALARAKPWISALYATQNAFVQAGMPFDVENDDELVAAIYWAMFVCDRCFFWCNRDEESAEHPNSCVDCVKADEEE